MKTILHKALTRGYFDHGWLQTHHTFSFADYYDPARVNFGALRVLNDDVVAPGMGFGLHPHRNMEIVSIPLSGALEHRDSMGHVSVIRPGEIQVMSAGTGVQHSEYNEQKDKETNFLQIWVIPEFENVQPRYENLSIADYIHRNRISTFISPHPGHDTPAWLYQQVWFSMADMDADKELVYKFKSPISYGVYAFVIEGDVEVAGEPLTYRDGLGVTDARSFSIRSYTEARVLLVEVPFIG